MFGSKKIDGVIIINNNIYRILKENTGLKNVTLII